MDEKQKKLNTRMLKNLRSSISYYRELFNNYKEAFGNSTAIILEELSDKDGLLNEMQLEMEGVEVV